MFRRKIQLVGGSSYTISLPKEWVTRNKLKEKDEVTISEKGDKTLIIGEEKKEELQEIEFNVDEYKNIKQILFGLYYIGIEKITFYSKTKINKDVKTEIRKVMSYMSGTEIVYEDNKKIIAKVFLDKLKVDVKQTIFRISLIIDNCIQNIVEGVDIKEMRTNEEEIDRLYHLLTKVISLALIDSNVLHSSNIKNTIKIPSFFLISKKLENTGDSLYYLAKHLNKNKIKKITFDQILEKIKNQLMSSTKFIIGKNKNIYELQDDKGIKEKLSKIEDKIIVNHLQDIRRYVKDISEEVVSLSFYNTLIEKNKL